MATDLRRAFVRTMLTGTLLAFLTTALARVNNTPGKDCETAYASHFDPDRSDMPHRGHKLAFVLADCLLAKSAEAYKTDMASTSILFGLLLSILSQIMPSVTDLSRLSLRRPVLAFMLGFGGMYLPVLSGRDDSSGKTVEPYPHMSLDLSDRENRSLRVAVIVSAMEYLIAAAAVLNVLYFTWTMTYVGVSFSVIQIYITNLPETAIPIMWMLLVPLVHLVAFFAIRYATNPQPEDKKNAIGSRTNCSRVVTGQSSIGGSSRPQSDRGNRGACCWNTPFSSGVLIHLIAGTAILRIFFFMEQWQAIPTRRSDVGRGKPVLTRSGLIIKFRFMWSEQPKKIGLIHTEPATLTRYRETSGMHGDSNDNHGSSSILKFLHAEVEF
ncbi:hypothetical protein CSOJ01_07808 [Colletotrichum sojae]|uniref:Uncharacterized protein n=1 Tax=Colletotrichum sojae TaxID=2175907 RepID=A0A8H6MTU1_9PEZI|nr:hypothetical protein CSOJ01_07808 [Colletotrichum sojae]